MRMFFIYVALLYFIKMCANYIYFGACICALGLTFGYNIHYISSSTNTCIDTCEAESMSLIQCITICSQSQDCKGIAVDRDYGTCCTCYELGIPGQTFVPGKVLYRATNGTLCNRDIVSDVPDSHLTASSSYKTNYSYYGPDRGRLRTQESANLAGSWCSLTITPNNQYIQARFYSTREIFGIATQGRNHRLPKQYVTSYKVSYSVDCVTFAFVRDSNNTPKVFPGNFNQDTVIQNVLPESILAVCVRIHPVTVIGHPSMRFGLMGFDY